MNTNTNQQESQATEISIAKNGKAVKLPESFNAAQVALLTQKSPANLIRTRKGSGGKELKYLPHNFVTEMLNQAFGFAWSFHTEVISISEKECVVKGKITVHNKSQELVKEQYGSQLVLKGMATGDALKGAGSDALRKCASLLGIGLDLYGEEHTEEPVAVHKPTPVNAPFNSDPESLVSKHDLIKLENRVKFAVETEGRNLVTIESFLERLAIWCNRKWGLESWGALLKWQFTEIIELIPEMVVKMRNEAKTCQSQVAPLSSKGTQAEMVKIPYHLGDVIDERKLTAEQIRQRAEYMELRMKDVPVEVWSEWIRKNCQPEQEPQK